MPQSTDSPDSHGSSESVRHLRALLDGPPLLALGVLVGDRPYVGQVPFAVWRLNGSLIVHVSALARHSRGLGDGAYWSGLIGAAGAADSDPFQVPRVSLEGAVRRLERSSPDYAQARDVYLDRLPSGRGHFTLGDFSLIELEVARGRLVAGFASTFNLTSAHLRAL